MKKHTLFKLFALFISLTLQEGELKAQVYTLGTGAASNANTDDKSPYGNFYGRNRHQLLIKASELTSLAASAGGIQSLSFNVNVPNAGGTTTLSGFTISMKQTSATALTTVFDNTGLTTVFGPVAYTETTGWNKHTFTTPFCWDGISNILVNVCFDNGSSSSSNNCRTYCTNVGFNAVNFSDGTAPCNAANSSASVKTGQPHTNRPDMKIEIVGGLDISVYDITSPLPVIDVLGSSNVITAVIKNNSCSDTITNATFGYKWNSNPPVTQSWTGSIAPGGGTTSFSFITPLTATPAGLNILKVWTSRPNGVTDSKISNDTMYFSVFVKDGFVSAVPSFQGKDFWVGFLSNNNDPTADLEVHIASKSGAKGLVYLKGSSPVYAVSFNIAAGTVVNYRLPFSFVGQLTTEVKNTKGINIVSENDIVVYAGNYLPYTSDAATAIPTNALGTSYDIIAMGSPNGTSALFYPGEFVVVGTQDNTTVTVNMSTVPSQTMAAASTNTYALNKGETYHVVAKTPGLVGRSTDLTGVRITSDKPVAVFAGDECIYVGNCAACDHLYEQIRPTVTWGKEYYLAATQKGSVTADVVRIYAPTAANVTVNTGGAIATYAVAARGYKDVDIAGVGMQITSNNAIHVSQYLRGSTCSAPPLAIDPLMLDILPVNQWGSSYIFATSSYFRYSTHYMTFVINSTQTGSLQLNGAALTGVTWNAISGTSYSYGYKTLMAGMTYNVNSITNTPFGVYIYGYGQEESYGYTAGGFLTNLTLVPVELLSFKGKLIGNNVLTEWNTASETNTNFYTIERSPDGINFTQIGVVKAAGNAVSSISYSFIDINPEQGINYYRLKMTDLDGKFKYSAIVPIKTGPSFSLEITSIDIDASKQMELSFQLQSIGSENVRIYIYDLLGQKVLEKDLGNNLSEGVYKTNVDVSNLHHNLYFVKLKAGGLEKTKKLIITQ